MTDPTERFSGRSADYVRYRPSYPPALVTALRARHDGDRWEVADLGSGTGIFTRLLLDGGATVRAVEPNAEMRAAAEADLAGHDRFESVAGTAEGTTLPDASVDLVTAAQAFHWFDVARTRREVKRILRPEGLAAFVWNDRDRTGSAFLRGYEELLNRHCPDYGRLQGKADDTRAFDAFFGAGAWERLGFSNAQRLDRPGLVGRVMSSSYAPARDAPAREALAKALEALFDAHATNGAVTIPYEAVAIVGRVK